MNKACDLHERRFSNKAEELAAYSDYAEKTDNKGMKDLVDQVRAGIREAGRTEAGIKHLSQGEGERPGGKTALATFNKLSKETSLNELTVLADVAKNAGKSVRETVFRTLKHEDRHERADEAEGAEKFDRVIAYLFGHEAVHNVEEATASLGTTEDFDAYQKEREEAQVMAQELGISLLEFSNLKLTGNHERVYEMAANSGLIQLNEEASNSPPSLNINRKLT